MKKLIYILLIIIGLIALLVYVKGLYGIGMGILNTSLKMTQTTTRISDISFGTEDWQTLDVYPQPVSNKLAPVMVFIHGGGWHWGNKNEYYFIADAFYKLGYTVVVPNYTKYPQGRFPDFIYDGAKALAWAKQNINKYNGNPKQIFLSGHSAGAHTGALLVSDDQYLQSVGMIKSDIKAFIGIAGPYNFTPVWPQYIETFGPENFEAMKASTHIDGSEPPMLLLHAKGDEAVGLFNFNTLLNDLKTHNVLVKSHLYEQDINHISIILKLHPWFAGEFTIAKDIHHFTQSVSANGQVN